MRRALVLVSVLAAALLGTGLASATAAAPRTRPEPEIAREIAFELHAEGFRADVYVTNNDGDVTAMLIVSKGPRVAYYSVPATVTAERVTADYGAFGELDYTFRPKGKGSQECLGASDNEDEAELEGVFRFTGEEEYVHLEAARAEGTMHLYPVPKQCSQKRRARRVVPYSPTYSDEGATLRANAGSPKAGVAREVSVYDDGRGRVAIFAYLGERVGGVDVARGVQTRMHPGAFHWSLAAGTATLRPPAPFTGSAKFTRHGNNGHGAWTGSLTMPILGGEPVSMAGDEFSAFIHRGTPQDE